MLLFLLVLFPCGAFAECVSVNQITKCARLPTDLDWDYLAFSGFVYGADGLSWSLVYNGDVMVSGVSSGGGLMKDVACTITYPFKGEYVALVEPNFEMMDFTAQICTDEVRAPGWNLFSVAALDGDICPDGFYTVPYNVSCGEGLVDITDVPYCNDDTSGDYCLMSVSAAPCAAGITTLRTGTGVIVPLWAERVTEPSLCVKYNDMVCYGNLEVGRAVSAFNVNYNGVVYHTVD